MGIVQITAPTAEPIGVAQARAWCRIDTSDEDETITMLIKAARRFIERRTNRALITSTWRMTLDRFPCPCPEIRIPRGPVTAVTAINYVDASGTPQILAPSEYVVDLSAEPARIAPAWNKTWPVTLPQIGAVTIDFTAGYATAEAVPEDLTLAMRLLIGHWSENRESVVVGAVSTTVQLSFDELVDDHRLWTFK